jgi:ankyrin repeat protein
VSHHGTGITIWETERRVEPASLGQAWRGITNEYWGENARGHVYVRIPPSQEYIWPDAREKIAAALDVADTAPRTPDEVARVVELREALKVGDANKVGILVQANPDIVNTQLHRHHVGKGVWLGGTALHWAAQKGDTATAATLLRNGADIEAVYSQCRSTPLHCAARAGRKELARLLLQHGAKVDAKDRVGKTPLYEAAREGRADVVALLLDRGAVVNVVIENACKRTPLHIAAERGHVDVVGTLLARGADLKAVTSYNYWTALHNAAFRGDSSVVELLLAKGAEVEPTDKKGRTPLDLAEEIGHAEIAEMLRRHGGE